MHSFRLFQIAVLTWVSLGAAGHAAAEVGQTASASHKTRHKAAKTTSAPVSIGKFGDWQAATHVDAGELSCYAFSRPQSSEPALVGRDNDAVVFTVTERTKLRDTVALSAGFAYAANAEVTVAVGSQKFPFYTSGRSAFARDGGAVIAAFDRGDSAAVVSPGPKGKDVTDHFRLTGFSAAFKAVLAACPDKS